MRSKTLSKFSNQLHNVVDAAIRIMKKNQKRTIAKVLLRYREKTYLVRVDFYYNYPRETALFLFEEGNYSCDCNRSSLIQQQCDKEFPDMDCGSEIKMIGIEITPKEKEGS